MSACGKVGLKGRKVMRGYGKRGGEVPATHINFFACVATNFSWYKQAPPPFIQFSSSSISSAPSKATSIGISFGSESKRISFNPAFVITCRDW